MKQKLIIRPEAEVDITSAVVWYEERERGLGNQLLSEIRSGINRALTAPDAYLKLRSQPAVHRILVRRFPYRMFYVTRPDAFIVLAVIHAARHDRHWLRRITS
jgi:toxin ParE1/3/4